jgi:hypothetical protein
MEKSNKRGKIPQADWPLIMARYAAGETLSSIARTYDCSPPAISYIVSRNKDHPANQISASPAAEPQLVKAAANGASENAAGETEPVVVRSTPTAELRPQAAVEASPESGLNHEQRGRLHLSLGNGGGNGNGSQTQGNGHGHGESFMANTRPSQPRFPVSPAPRPHGVDERMLQPSFQGPPRNGADSTEREVKPAQHARDAEAARKDGAFIDQELRDRVNGDIAAFLAAFDAALAEDTQASRFGLREATDRLLRAGARTRIELERLEARVPLPPRDGGARPDEATWRYR